MSIPSWLEKLESKVLPPISPLTIPESSHVSTTATDPKGGDWIIQEVWGAPTAEPSVNPPRSKPASGGSVRPNNFCIRKPSSEITRAGSENRDVNFLLKKGEGDRDMTQTVTYRAGDNVNNPTLHDTVSTLVEVTAEPRLSTQLTSPTSTGKNPFFISEENDPFGEGENGASLQEWVQGDSSPTYVDMVPGATPNTSEDLREELLETQAALKSTNNSLKILEHNYKKLWDAQEEDLRKALGEVERLLEDNRRLNEELEAVKLVPAGPIDSSSRIKSLSFPENPDRVEPSTVQVSQKVIDLNEEIFQVSAFIGEMIIPSGRKHGGSSEEMSSAFQKSRKLLGTQMTIVLAAEAQNGHKDVNPLLAQIVLQIGITAWCASVISRWKPWDENFDEVLDIVYSGIRKTGSQSLSGRWRSLTRSQLGSPNNDWATNFIDDLSCILLIAGWSTRNRDERYQFEKRLPAIFKSVQDVRTALGEDVINADIEIAIVDPGTPFKSKSMKDNYEDGRHGSATECVGGTTGIGLKKIVMKHTLNGLFPHVETASLPRPRVILERTFREMMNH